MTPSIHVLALRFSSESAAVQGVVPFVPTDVGDSAPDEIGDVIHLGSVEVSFTSFRHPGIVQHTKLSNDRRCRGTNKMISGKQSGE